MLGKELNSIRNNGDEETDLGGSKFLVFKGFETIIGTEYDGYLFGTQELVSKEGKVGKIIVEILAKAGEINEQRRSYI